MANKDYNAQYYQKHKERIKQQVKKYREAHKEEIAKKKYERKKKKIKNDKVYKLKEDMNNLIYYSFKRKRKYRQTSKATRIFGCDWQTFYNHLLKTFKDNYGYDYDEKEKVEVDHIIPMCKATTINEVIMLNHYTNLQLLKTEDNRKKYIY